jgi:zinc and cadmium transporter
MNLTVFFLLVAPVLLSGATVLFVKTNARVLKLITAFSGAYLLAISFLEIVPEIYESEMPLNPGIFILIGFFIQLLLDFISRGVEHGHEHHHHDKNRVPVLPLMIGISLHSFLEGMPLAESFETFGLQNTLLTGIIIHNIPISIVLMGLLMMQNNKKVLKSFILLTIFALSAPAGTLVSNFIGMGLVENPEQYFGMIMAMVVGIFLHISTTILFETDEEHRFNFLKFISIVAGVAAAVLLMHDH